ncbi:prostaglandin reductase 1-like [Amphiura filiformis]|uniref:prostaglandin reductase 1-like n=1 Tax=Amphiura filiformis TaxID=82378 RepID=UPI003B227843
MKGKRWVIAKRFQGAPKDGDLTLEDFELPDLKDGEVLVEAVCLTVDPYMRPYSRRLNIGDKMIGQQVARVVSSKSKDYSVGDHVLSSDGWTSHAITNAKMRKVQLPDNLPLSLALGVLGMPGMTAYNGLIDICNPKAGETVLVSGAAGAVGSLVGQIAKNLGCRVIGFAGSDAKLQFLKELGFDEAINYKKITDLDATIKSVAPKGVDVYFDNVGGEFSTTVMENMNDFGRVSACGAISQYNAEEQVRVPSIMGTVVSKRLKIQGFIVSDFEQEKNEAAIKQNIEWIKQGKLKYREHVTKGFENMYKAFQELFTGANTGKAIVNV